MESERFQQLLRGPLDHPLVMFRITRLMLALRHVVEATGEQGEKALEEYCHSRQLQDDANDH